MSWVVHLSSTEQENAKVSKEESILSLSLVAGFWQLNAGRHPTFVPTVAEPWHLSEIIRHILRLAVCGSQDDRQECTIFRNRFQDKAAGMSQACWW